MRVVYGNRRFRKQQAAHVRKGSAKLVVIGSTQEGFMLAVERPNSFALVGLRVYTRQKHAIGVGINHYGTKPAIRRPRKAA
jgi:hypothetical protein